MLMAQTSPEQLPTLTTARGAHQLTLKEAARAYPVLLRAVVTYYDPYIDARRPAFFVSDASGGVFVALSTTPKIAFKTGELVEISGVSGAGDFAPIVDRASARVIGSSHLPLTAPRVSLNDMLSGAEDGQWVEVEGLVQSVLKVDKNVFLDLVLGDGAVSAVTVEQPSVDYARLVDSKVILRGNSAPTFNHQGQLTGSHLLFPDLTTVQVEEAGAADPYVLPVGQIDTLLRYTPNTAFQHRVHIRGTVTLFWPGRLLCIQDQSKGLCAQTEQTSPLNTGDLVDVIGFPIIGEFTPTLHYASYRPAGRSLAAPAIAVTAEQALRGNDDAMTVQIEGRLIGENLAADDPTLVFSSGNFLFSAVSPRPFQMAALPSLEVGSWVRITGIDAVQSNGTGRTTGAGFPIPKFFRILMRSPKDVVVVQRASWWNAQHTLLVLALALAITLLALVSAVMLSHRVRR